MSLRSWEEIRPSSSSPPCCSLASTSCSAPSRLPSMSSRCEGTSMSFCRRWSESRMYCSCWRSNARERPVTSSSSSSFALGFPVVFLLFPDALPPLSSSSSDSFLRSSPHTSLTNSFWPDQWKTQSSNGAASSSGRDRMRASNSSRSFLSPGSGKRAASFHRALAMPEEEEAKAETRSARPEQEMFSAK
eukprot:390678-Hanusia_phi.AAC.1